MHAEEPDQVVVGIETDRGLWVGALTAAGYQVFAVNPLAVARYRDRHHLSGAKSDASDASDAKLLADLVRTDRHNHRPVAGDSPDAEAIKVLARAHQSLIWTRTRHTNALRNALREYYPAALEAFDDLAHGDALGVLDRAPSPAQGVHLTVTAIQAALKLGSRQRNIAARAREIHAVLRTEQLGASPPVAAAFAATTRAAVHIIAELNRQIAELETAWLSILRRTRTPTFTAPCQDLVSCSAPWYSGLAAEGDREPICLSCAGIPGDFTCRQCGAEGDFYRRRTCARCALRGDLTANSSHGNLLVRSKWRRTPGELRSESQCPNGADRGEPVVADMPLCHYGSSAQVEALERGYGGCGEDQARGEEDSSIGDR